MCEKGREKTLEKLEKKRETDKKRKPGENEIEIDECWEEKERKKQTKEI